MGRQRRRRFAERDHKNIIQQKPMNGGCDA
jgi:hypothetical protein